MFIHTWNDKETCVESTQVAHTEKNNERTKIDPVARTQIFCILFIRRSMATYDEEVLHSHQMFRRNTRHDGKIPFWFCHIFKILDGTSLQKKNSNKLDYW